jgi:hypothetical protein
VRFRVADLIHIHVGPSQFGAAPEFGIAIGRQRSEKVYFKYASIKRLSSGASADQRRFDLFADPELRHSIEVFAFPLLD